MTKKDVERILEEEQLGTAYHLLEDGPDRENEVVLKMQDDFYIVYQTDEHAQMTGKPSRVSDAASAFDIFLCKLRAIKTKRYERLFDSRGAERVLRITADKTFLSRYEFEASYHELYKAKDGTCFSVLRIDPAPGGYGEEFMYIRDVYEADPDVNGKAYSDEELLQLGFSEGKKI